MNRSYEDVRLFIVARHHDDNLRSRHIVQDLLESPGPPELLGDQLIDAEEPGDSQEGGEGPEGKPLKEIHHVFGP